MEQLYNPTLMSEEELRTTFVARQPLVDKLVSIVRDQPTGAGVQHVVLLGPRGMGKTTILLMLQYTLSERGLVPPWIPVRLSEELFSVNDLADFWLEVLRGLADTTGDKRLAERDEYLRLEFSKSADLAEAIVAELKDWCRSHKRRILLLVDNLNHVLSAMNEQETASLRRVLMNDDFLMLLGAAPTFLREAGDYRLPLYHFFKIEHLRQLNSEEVRELLIRRASLEPQIGFEQKLRENEASIRVLEYFTGGSPRLLLMLYRVIASTELSEVTEALEELLDRVTPYFKDKIETLPPQQRKILDFIARRTGETHEGVQPGVIAKETRLLPAVVSTQLRRLTDMGYVHPTNTRGRKVFYVISEQLFVLWYQMRFGRGTKPMVWLVDFLKAYYSIEELDRQGTLLEERYRSLWSGGLPAQACAVLRSNLLLLNAMNEQSRASGFERIAKVCVDLQDDRLWSLATEIGILDRLPDIGTKRLNEDSAVYVSRNTRGNDSDSDYAALTRLFAQIAEAPDKIAALDSALTNGGDDASIWLAKSLVRVRLGDTAAALVDIDQATRLAPLNPWVWMCQGQAFFNSERYDEALQSVDRAIQMSLHHVLSWGLRAEVLRRLNRIEEAMDSASRASEIAPDSEAVWKLRLELAGLLGSESEIVNDVRVFLSSHPGARALRVLLTTVLVRLGRSGDAFQTLSDAIDGGHDSSDLRYMRCRYLDKLDRPADALRDINRAIEMEPAHNAHWWLLRAGLLLKCGREAEILEQLDGMPEDISSKESRAAVAQIHVLRFVNSCTKNDLDAVRKEWACFTALKTELGEWNRLVISYLVILMFLGHSQLVEDLMHEPDAPQRYFPFLRAAEYARTGSADLIENLSPEMKPIVMELVEKINRQRKIAESVLDADAV